jgi:hypothetical protein
MSARRGGAAAAAACAAACALVALPSVARADGTETDRQIAQSLFDDGRALMEAHRYAEACPKFADSQRLDPGGGTLLNLALCHELEGKTATAWTEFRDALSLAQRDDRKDRQELASLHIAALGPKLMRLTVIVPEGVAAREPEVTLDRSRLPSAAWNTSIPVDPGEHRIAVTARGLTPWETSLAAEEPGRTYRVDVPPLDRDPGCPPGSQRQGEACVSLPEPREVRGRSTAFWLVLGGAGISLGTSAITGLMALSANKYVSDNCSADRNFCRVPDAADAATRARTYAWLSTATLAVGVGGALVAFLLPLEKKSPVTAGFDVRDGAAFATVAFSPGAW